MLHPLVKSGDRRHPLLFDGAGLLHVHFLRQGDLVSLIFDLCFFIFSCFQPIDIPVFLLDVRGVSLLTPFPVTHAVSTHVSNGLIGFGSESDRTSSLRMLLRPRENQKIDGHTSIRGKTENNNSRAG